MIRTRFAIFNAVMFQLLWFIAVQGDNIFALSATLLFFAVHGAYFIRGAEQWWFITGIAVVGWLVDSIGNTIGVIHFSGATSMRLGGTEIWFAPLWLFCIWLCFASTLLFSFYWLYQRRVLASVLGFFMVPLSYYGGAVFSESIFMMPVYQALLIIASCWAILLPLGLSVAQKKPSFRMKADCYG